MLSYVIRRILLMIPTVLGMTAVVFFIMKLSPGDPVQMMMTRQEGMRPGDRAVRLAYLDRRYGLNSPYVVQYGRWLDKVSPVGTWTNDGDSPPGWGFLTGHDKQGHPEYFGFKIPDLGHSFVKNRPVLDLIEEALPITVLLNVVSIPLIYIISILSGVYAARYRGKSFDVVSGMTMLALWAVPAVWAGVLLQGFLANQQYIHAFPTSGLHAVTATSMPFLPHATPTGWERGWLLDTLWHLVLPVICMSYAGFAFLSKLTRGSVLENLRADFVRTARAKGVNEKDVLWQHVFRNSLLPLITVAVNVLPGLLAGAVVVEYIFGINGMGKMMLEAIEVKDQEVVMAVVMASSALTLVAYLVADLLYAVADPRISYD